MEKNIINVVFIVILIFSHTLIYGFDLHEDVDSEDAIWGTRVPHIAKNADMCNVQNFSAEVITPEIESSLKAINKLEELKLTDPTYVSRVANEILSVASCFSLDPLVFTSLIGHESFFYNKSVSHTGALGLGQLTTITLNEIAQQLHADHVDSLSRGSDDARAYFQEAIHCVEEKTHNSVAFKHWWTYDKKSQWVNALKNNTALNLTYSAMIYKIAFSRTVSIFSRYSKTIQKNIDQAIQSILNLYNGASKSEQISHYKKTRKKMNIFLSTLNQKSNVCYDKSIKN